MFIFRSSMIAGRQLLLLLLVSCLRGGGRQRRSPGCRRSAATGARGTLGFHRINPAPCVTTHACRQKAARTTAVFLLPLSAKKIVTN